MYPEQPQSQPGQQPPYQPQVAEQPPMPKKSLKLPIILMVWPAAAIVVLIILSVLINAIFQDPQSDSELFGNTSPIKTVTNLIVLAAGGGTAVLGPISFIIGLVLLIQRKSKR
jgi:hypothetical protein